MKPKTHLAGIVILLAVVLSLAACNGGAPAPAAPTADANAVYTQAAATVSAGLTQAADKNPAATPTFAPPTETPTAINALPSPTLEQPGPGNATPSSTPAAGTPAAGTLQATATPLVGITLVPTATKAAGGAPAPATGDKATWVRQGPNDGSSIPASATFNAIYVLKNTGTTTWTTKYSLRYYAGDKMSSPNDTNLTKEVKPGDTVEIPFQLIAPDTTGKTHTIWTLSNADGANFYYVTMDLVIK